MKKNILPGPVAIGGVGGSGTRVFAEILRGFGFYIGDCLNGALDNLWFTLLCKRPHWFFSNRQTDGQDIHLALRIFAKAMTCGFTSQTTEEEINYVRQAAREISSYPVNMGACSMHAEKLLESRPVDSAKYYGWGWKEPNSHIFLNHLATCFPNLQYIHVLRHGLDMAYSGNQQQLLNWGKLYGVTVIDKNRVSPQELLHYWIAANNHAIKTGKMLLQDRFLVIRLEDLCTQPRSSIKTMANFLGLGLDTDRLAKLESLPIMPKSSGRYREHDLSLFSDADIQSVEEFGFKVES